MPASQPEQYRRVIFSDLASQAVNNVLSFLFGDTWMLSRSVARQKNPQYYRNCRRYSYTSHTYGEALVRRDGKQQTTVAKICVQLSISVVTVK